MLLRERSAALFFVVSVLLAGLIAGCARDQTGDGGSQGTGEQGKAAQSETTQGGATQAKAPELKVALGKVKAVKPDRRKIILKPSTEQQGDRLVFKVVDNAQIQLDNRPAEMADVQKGQRAQIEYVVVNEQNKARTVELISSGGEGTGG